MMKEELTHVGQLIVADHIVFRKEEEEGIGGEPCALFINDMYSELRDLPSLPDKTADEAKLALRTFVGSGTVDRFFSDRSLELKKATRDLKFDPPPPT